ncbi:MAG: tetratricopeptide repeat protein [Isosphaeraceae bacterium]
MTVAQPRLLRNRPDVRWRYRVHEQILPACLAAGARTLATDVVIRHSGYASPGLCVRKQERNLRLLQQERAENPEDPWVLFQLGKFAAERPDGLEEARGLLLQAHQLLARGQDPLKRQVHAALGTTLRRLGLASEAAEVLREGLSLYPNDATLLSESGLLAFESGELAKAEDTFTTLLKGPADPDELFGAVDLSLRGWQARHYLASVHRRQGRAAEAEAQWRAALSERPDAAVAWLGLCELYLGQGCGTSSTRR